MNRIIELMTVGEAKAFAERFRDRLQSKHGVVLGQGKALHLLAEIGGFSTWPALRRHLQSADRPKNTSLEAGHSKWDVKDYPEINKIILFYLIQFRNRQEHAAWTEGSIRLSVKELSRSIFNDDAILTRDKLETLIEESVGMEVEFLDDEIVDVRIDYLDQLDRETSG